MKKSENNIKVQVNLPSHVQESIKRITEMSKFSVIRELADQLEQMKEASLMPVRDAALQMSKAMEAARFYEKFDLSKVARKNQEAVNQIIETQKSVAENFNFDHLKAVESLVQNMNRIHSELSSIANIHNLQYVAASQSVINSIPRIDLNNLNRFPDKRFEETGIQELDANSFDELINYFDDKIDSLSKGSVNAQGLLTKLDRIVTYLMLLIGIATYIQNKNTSAQNEILIRQQKETNEYLESLDEFANKVYPKIEKLTNKENKEELLITIKRSTLRVNPFSKSDSVATVYPNQLLNIIQDEKRWFYVEYFDHKETIPKMGWIYKGNVEEYSQQD